MSDERLTSPGVWFPPPTLFVVGFLIGLTLDRWVIRLRLDDVSRSVLVVGGWLLIALGLVILLWAMLTFLRARTAILPSRPARSIVATGPYRFTRNPMYVAMSAIYTGLALLMGVGWPLVLLPIVLLSLAALVIRREERYLGDAFGEEYAAYRARVRRWL
ncbi:MAG TPA: isoprenylcysteine carboxylmethyltransferase family protein [Gemmatimonadaceae bacterium]